MLVGRIGRPGLLGTIARTAVVAGTATMTANAVNRHAAGRAGERHATGVHESQWSPAPPPGDDLVSQLTRLAGLHDSGALSDDEFEAAKQELLAG